MPLDVSVLTELLRRDDRPAWSFLRSALDRRGVDVGSALLAFSAEQGDDSEFGVLVTGHAEVIEFSWQPSTGSIFEWLPITDRWRSSPYADVVAEAFKMKPSG